MIEQSPISEGRGHAAPIMRFSAAMRVANETPPEDFGPPEPAQAPEASAGPEAAGEPDTAGIARAGETPETDSMAPMVQAPHAAELAAVRDTLAEAAPLDEPVPLLRRFGEVEAGIEKLAERFDQLEFVIVEQFEPGMSQPGERPAGNLRERLDRIEARLDLLSGEPGAAPPSHASQDGDDALAAADTAIDDRLGAIAERLADVVAADARRSAAADAAEARLRTLERAVDDMTTATEAGRMAVLEALDRVSQRPPPAPDLTLQHRSFAGFATALQTTLDRFETSVGTILERLDGVTERVAALEDGLVRSGEDTPSQPARGLDISVAALSDRISTLAEVLGTRHQPELQEITVVSARLEQMGSLLSTVLEEAGKSNPGSIDETLRDLRMTIAEIAAENRRLRIA